MYRKEQARIKVLWDFYESIHWIYVVSNMATLSRNLYLLPSVQKALRRKPVCRKIISMSQLEKTCEVYNEACNKLVKLHKEKKMETKEYKNLKR